MISWQKLCEALPHAKLVMLRDAGHTPHIEKPVQVCDAITDFVLSLERGEKGSDVSAPEAQ